MIGGGQTPEKPNTVKWTSQEVSGNLVGDIDEENKTLIITTQGNKAAFVLFNNDGKWTAGAGVSQHEQWTTSFLAACVANGYDVENYELEDSTMSPGDTLPNWSEYVYVSE